MAAFFAFSTAARAQMVSGENMVDFHKTFGLGGKPAFDVTPTQSDVLVDGVLRPRPEGRRPSNILAPGQQPRLTFVVENRADRPLRADGKLDILRYGSVGIPGDIWKPVVVKFEDLPAVPVAVDIPANGSALVTLDLDLPETFGAYALILDLGEHGRRLALSMVRTFAPNPRRIQFPSLSLDAHVGVETLESLGIQALRIEWGALTKDHPQYQGRMNDLRARMQSFADHNVTVLLTLSFFQDDRMPLGRGRPHLDADDNMVPTKQDLVNMPQYDGEFREYVAEVCREFGWPKGPLTAVQLWNEPWEGISISGWGADMIRYRDLYRAMALGVEDARADGAQVLLTGCDSSSNSLDKLFPDDSDEFLPWFDACTIHYQGLWSPALYKKWRDREHPENGRVKIWDTESWVANSDDRVAAVIAACRAAGYDRAMGIFHGNVAGSVRRRVTLPDGAQKNVDMHFPWSPAAAVGAAQHFIGERPFREFLFRNGLPWLMRFDGVENADDGLVVAVGDLGEAFHPDMLPFRRVKGLDQPAKEAERARLRARLAENPPAAERQEIQARLQGMRILSGARMKVADPDGEFALYDFYGNPQTAEDGVITVPLNALGYYLRADAARPGSFERLVAACRAARIEGLQPVEIVTRDFLAPVPARPDLRVVLTNVLNREVTGTLSVESDGLRFADAFAVDTPEGWLRMDGIPADAARAALPAAAPASAWRVTLPPGASRVVAVATAGGAVRPDNRYPVAVRFDAGEDGAVDHRESLRVNVVARRTIAVDGALDDWEGVLPQAVSADGSSKPDLTEAAWLPMVKFPEHESAGHGAGFLAYDDEHFYFAAKIADTSPCGGTIRYAERDDDAFFYPEVTYDYDRAKVMWSESVTWNNAERAVQAPALPDGGRHHTALVAGLAGGEAAYVLDLDIPADRPRQVTLYFVDWEGTARNGFIEIRDRETNRELDRRQHIGYTPTGLYVPLFLSGKVRVRLVSNWNSCLALAGVFVDPLPAGGPRPGAGATSFGSVRMDRRDTATNGEWAGQYGAEGYWLPGLESKLPEDIALALPEYKERSEYRWPEGVRRYSYRMRPPLPHNGFDNVQIAFNAVAVRDEADMIPSLPGVPVGFIPYKDTDYEYDLNPVSAAHGGGTEIWRAQVPGLPEKHFYPRQPKHPLEGAVADGRLAVSRDGATRIVEASIPWREMPDVKKALDEKRPVKFAFRVNDNRGPSMELGHARSATQLTHYAFYPRWGKSWSNEIEFAFENE